MKKYPLFILFILFSSLLLSFQALGETSFQEGKGNSQAVPFIMEEDWDEIITRGEFSVILAQSLNLSPASNDPFLDLQDYSEKGLIAALYQGGIIMGFPEGNFLPHIQLTRGEASTMLIRALGLHRDEYRPRLEKGSHWAYGNITLMNQLGFMERGDPGEYITRNEANYFIENLKRLQVLVGTITETYPLSQKIAIQTEDGRILIDMNQESLLFRNNRQVSFQELRSRDKVYLILDELNKIEYLKATGILLQEEIAMELSYLLGGLLSWQEVEALASFEWEMLGSRAMFEIEDFLAKEGLTPNEIEALISTDWDALNELGKARMVEALSMETKVPKDLLFAIINWNWDEILEISQLELLQILVEEILHPSYLKM